MAAPRGNQFWKRRSKHGRDKIFASAELMWEAAAEYFNWCDKTPINDVTVNKRQVINFADSDDKGATKDYLTDRKTGVKNRPYTISGLCVYLGTNSKYFNDFYDRLTEDQQDFSEVIDLIREIIYTHKFEGATVGIFNSNIIARDLGLSENAKVDHTTNGESLKQEIDYTKLSDEALREIAAQKKEQ